MKEMDKIIEQEDFIMEGSVIVAWKVVERNKREFVGLYFADADETKEGMLEENKLDENPIKHNILIPSFLLESLDKEEKVALTLRNLKNDIWEWTNDSEFEEAANDLFE